MILRSMVGRIAYVSVSATFVALLWLNILIPDSMVIRTLLLSSGGVFLVMLLAGVVFWLFAYSPSKRDFVAHHSTDVRFLDGVCRDALVSITRTFRTRAADLESYEWRFEADNGLSLESVRVLPGLIGSVDRHLGQERVIQEFGRPLSRWKTYAITFNGVFREAFTDPVGAFWSTTVAQRTRLLEVSIRFHPEKLPVPESIEMRERIGDSTFILSGQGSTLSRDPDNYLRFTFTLKHPKQFSIYTVAWQWAPDHSVQDVAGVR